MGLFHRQTPAEKLRELSDEYNELEQGVNNAIQTHGAGSREYLQVAKRLDKAAKKLNSVLEAGKVISREIEKPLEKKKDHVELLREIRAMKDTLNNLHSAIAQNKIFSIHMREAYARETNPDKKYRIELQYNSLISSQKKLIKNLNSTLKTIYERELELKEAF